MSGVVTPENEEGRMRAVRRYEILDTPPDGSFDRITAIAARRFRVPISIISVVDHDRIWFKSHHGIDVSEIGRDAGLCASAILASEPHILKDASIDPRSLTNPLVAGEFGLRFYAGVPLQTSDGYNLGTLCVIDQVPRTVDQDQIEDLKDLASVVMDHLELRLSARNAVSKAEILAREIDHRVMNSLQFISALLNMQSRIPGVSSAADQLKIASNRVAAVARVHRHFYSNVKGETVSCLPFLERLCADLAAILEKSVTVEGDEGTVATTRIQPIGLIVNELVTNAAKHGVGQIVVTFRADGEMRELIVSDEGLGPAADFVPAESEGLGMKVVTVLAKQLGGSLAVSPHPQGRGSCFSVMFPA